MNKLCVFFRIIFLLAVIVFAAACPAAPIEENTEGTESNPFLVNDAAALKRIGRDISDGWTLNAHYRQTADIVLNAAEEWMPIGASSSAAFSGVFDGNGYTIQNLFIDNSSGDQGLFGNINGAALKNIGLINVTINGGRYIGGIVGHNISGTVENCYVEGSVTGEESVGGIAGYNEDGMIKNCYTVSDITGNALYIGGVTGENEGRVYNCYAAGSVTGVSHVGGIAGQTMKNGAELLNCVALNPVVSGSGNNEHTGRVIGLNETDGALSHNYARGSMILKDDEDIITPAPSENQTFKKHGEGITKDEWENPKWWNGDVENIWDAKSPWDFSSVWKWNDKTRLPVLRNARETQDHTLE